MSLRDRLTAQIRASGPMSVAQYMHACLHDPDYGYYATRPALGEAGDSGFGELPSPVHQAPAAINIKAPDAVPLPAEPDLAVEPAASLPPNLESWLDAQERAVLVRALGETGFNRTAAAARLGLNLRQMRYRMMRLGITAPSDDAGDDAG